MSSNIYDNQDTYEVFRATYERQHPASVPKFEMDINEYPRWVRIAVAITFICAAAVSGIHTVPTVWQSIEVNEIVTEQMRVIVSYASLAAVELAILLSAYLMAKGVKLAYGVMLIASSVAVLANLYSVIRAFSSGNDNFALVVSIALGIGAPMIALFSGKMFVDIQRADRIQDARAKKQYKESMVAWDAEIETAFKAYLKNTSKNRMSSANLSVAGHRLSDTLSVQTTDRQTDRHELPTNSRQSGAGFSRVSSATEQCLAHLRANPDDAKLPLRVLGERANVKKDSAAKALRLYMLEVSAQQTAQQNGHSEQ